jgi:uncharacterized membrane protein
MEIVVEEEEYTDQSEDLLKQWLQQSKDKSQQHNIKGKHYKKKHELFGLPATLLPIIYSPISGLLSQTPGIEIANVTVLILSGVMTGVYAFFDFGRKAELHFRYEALYSDLTTTILVELTKKREIRIRADRFIEMIQSKIDGFSSNEPLL